MIYINIKNKNQSIIDYNYKQQHLPVLFLPHYHFPFVPSKHIHTQLPTHLPPKKKLNFLLIIIFLCHKNKYTVRQSRIFWFIVWFHPSRHHIKLVLSHGARIIHTHYNIISRKNMFDISLVGYYLDESTSNLVDKMCKNVSLCFPKPKIMPSSCPYLVQELARI